MNTKIKKKSRKKIFIGLIIVILIGIFAVPRLFKTGNLNYTEITPKKSDITTYYSFSGSVEAKNRQSVLADRIMQIKNIKVEVGQTVKKDDVLLETSNGEKIKAKIDGEIANIYIEENSQVMSGGKLMEIVDYSDLQLKVQVDEYDLTAIEEDKEATVTIHAISKDVTGKIVEVSKEGNYLNGVTFFTGIISLEKDEAVKVGMSAEAKVINQNVKDVVTLPMSSISFDDNNKPYVFIKDGSGNVIKKEITIGINDGVTVEIKSGVEIDDTILVAKKESQTSFGPGGMGRGNIDNSNRDTTGGKDQ